MLDCEGKRCVVVGGGKVAERKAASLVEAKADVVVISPTLTTSMAQWQEAGLIKWIARPYEYGDLQEALLIYAATNSVEINRQVAKEAAELRIPVNIVTSQEEGTFMSPSVMRRGKLIIAVSTTGAGPAAAKEIRHQLEHEFGDEYEKYTEFLYRIRSVVQSKVSDPVRRHTLLKAAATMDILNSIRAGSFDWWSDEEIESWIIQTQGE
nr:NAD(P)-dependent oxidoreductase [Paenibacillus sediminis]